MIGFNASEARATNNFARLLVHGSESQLRACMEGRFSSI
jgi:hypothetical protein